MLSPDATESREYAGGTLKADPAAQPKGCSVCFVPRPQNQYRKLNRPTKWAQIKLRVPSGKSAVFTDSKLYLRVPSGKSAVFTDSKLYISVPSGKCAVFTDRTYINLDFTLSPDFPLSLNYGTYYRTNKKRKNLATFPR